MMALISNCTRRRKQAEKHQQGKLDIDVTALAHSQCQAPTDPHRGNAATRLRYRWSTGFKWVPRFKWIMAQVCRVFLVNSILSRLRLRCHSCTSWGSQRMHWKHLMPRCVLWWRHKRIGKNVSEISNILNRDLSNSEPCDSDSLKV